MNNTIEKILGPWLEELWLPRSVFKMDELLEIVAKSPNDQDEEWLRFLQFLDAECSGIHFTNEKQWSDLLNIMHVNKLINQKSLRLSHLIRNRKLIELNASKIIQLNEQARRLGSIHCLTDELRSSLDNCQLEIKITTTPKDYSSLIASIDRTLEYLKLKCLIPLASLELELHIPANWNLNSTNHPQNSNPMDSHLLMINEIKLCLDRLTCFLKQFHELITIGLQLEPIMSIEPKKQMISSYNNKMNDPNKSNQTIGDTLSSCKFRYAQVSRFLEELIGSLVKKSITNLGTATKNVVAAKAKTRDTNNKSLVLMRLLKPNGGEFMNAQLYEISLLKHLNEARNCKLDLDSTFKMLRLEFGRFYFINDTELLRVIALDIKLITDGLNSIENQLIISKLYNNSISSFILNDECQLIIGCMNPYGEEVYFGSKQQQDMWVPLRKRVNLYSLEIVRVLNECMRKLRSSLASSLSQSLVNNPQEIDFNLTVQMMILAEQIKFCSVVEKSALNLNDGLKTVQCFYVTRLEELNKTVLDSKDNHTRSRPHSALVDYKLSACVSITIQFLSILDELTMKLMGGDISHDWNWLKQIRFYHFNSAAPRVECRLAMMKFDYKFDYLPYQVQQQQASQTDSGKQIGAFKRLIATKMTERCQLVASHSLNYLRLGANPYGPAGSGKTETIKALATQLGQSVIVHNCDECNDGLSLDRLIWGLAHTGLWGCFDEFNRLSESSLSSISSTLELVQTSLRKGLVMVEREQGNIMSLDQNAAFFITLNPIDKSARYAGRRRLPANLRSLFQPVSMVQVPMETIVNESLRIVNFAAGRTKLHDNKQERHEFLVASEKLCHLFATMKDKFMEPGSGSSTKDDHQIVCHCEWDLRLAVAVLDRFQRFRTSICNDNFQLQDLLGTSINIEVSPRLSFSQLALFQENLKQVFSSSFLKATPHPLPPGLNHLNELSIALYRQLETRSGVLLLGKTRSGKTTTWNQLKSALNEGHDQTCIESICLNPRSCHPSELFGSQAFSQESKWQDGLLTSAIRKATKMLQEINSLAQVWLIFDGPVDPDWVEALNSVLDDNQVLTLSSGERISFKLTDAQSKLGAKSIKIIIETDSVQFASPATISRLGLVYHETASTKKSSVPTANRLILYQADCAEQAWKVFLSNYGDDNNKITNSYMRYTCNALSSSHHLNSLLNEALDNCIRVLLIANLDEIESDCNWGTSTFLELLRFVVNEGSFYNPAKGWAVEPIEESFKIVVQVRDLHKLHGDRILTLCDMKSRIESKTPTLTVDLADLEDLVKSSHQITLLNVLCNGHSETQLIKILTSSKDTAHKDSLYFKDSITNKQNLDRLTEMLLSPIGAKSEQRSLWIMTDLQYKLMDRTQKAQLLHQLNWLSLRPNLNIQFLYLNYDKSTEVDGFWSSVGSNLSLKPYSSLFQGETRQEKLTRVLSSRIGQFEDQKTIDLLAKECLRLAVKIKFPEKQRARTEDQLISLIVALFNRFSSEIGRDVVSLTNGLDRLKTFEEDVLRVRDSCRYRRHDLERKRLEIQLLVESLNKAVNVLETRKRELEKLQVDQNEQASRLIARRNLVESELSRAKSLLESSKRDIGQYLKPEALNEIRSLRAPPKTIKDILDGLFLVLGVASPTWMTSKSFLAKGTLSDEIIGFNLEKGLNEEVISKLEKLMQDPARRDSFEPKKAERASKAILPVLNWLIAVLEFSKAFIKTKPLMNEVNQLQRDQDDLASRVSQSEEELRKLNEIIGRDRIKLEENKVAYEQFEQESSEIDGRIQKALKAVSDCQGQTTRWRERLTHLMGIQQPGKIALMTVFGSIITLFREDDYREMILPDERDRLTEQIYRLMSRNHPTTLDDSEQQQQQKKQFPLLIIRILFEESDVIGFINLIDNSDEFAQVQELQKYLISESSYLLGQSQEELGDAETSDLSPHRASLITCHELADWKNSLNVALQLGRLVLLHLPFDDENKSILLDIFDAIKSHQARAGKTRVLLAGKAVRYHDFVSLAPIRLITLELGLVESELEETMVSELVARFDSNLSESIYNLELELGQKRASRFRMESRLIESLALTSGATSNETLDENLINILSDLHKTSKQLECDVHELQKRLDSLRKKKSHYQTKARELSEFYLSHLRPLQKKETFYHFNLDEYVKLLLSKGNSLQDINYELVFKTVVRALKPQDKEEFLNAITTNDGTTLESEAADLNEILKEFVNHSPMDSCKESNAFKLMIVLHESTKSSPQIYIDDFFAHHKPDMIYTKVYATTTTSSYQSPQNSLETRITMLLGDSSNSRRQDSHGICVCILNAQLVYGWINSRLIKILEEASTTGSCIRVILVAEKDTNDHLSLDLDVINTTQYRYWHDESSLTLINRYDLYVRTLDLNDNDYMLESKSEANWKHKLILFHVICQERSRLQFWDGEYQFNCDQLSKALESLQKIRDEMASSIEYRSELFIDIVVHYVDNILYGNQMDTPNDELRLKKLSQRFLKSDRFMSTIDQLRQLRNARNAQDRKKILSNIIGSEEG